MDGQDEAAAEQKLYVTLDTCSDNIVEASGGAIKQV